MVLESLRSVAVDWVSEESGEVKRRVRGQESPLTLAMAPIGRAPPLLRAPSGQAKTNHSLKPTHALLPATQVPVHQLLSIVFRTTLVIGFEVQRFGG